MTEHLFEALRLLLMLVTPPLAASTIVGLVMSIIQGASQISDPALSFVPKLFATAVTIVLLLPWYQGLWQDYLELTWSLISQRTITVTP